MPYDILILPNAKANDIQPSSKCKQSANTINECQATSPEDAGADLHKLDRDL